LNADLALTTVHYNGNFSCIQQTHVVTDFQYMSSAEIIKHWRWWDDAYVS